MKCQVLISTYKSLDKAAAMALPQVEGLGYLISCQSEPMPIPLSLQRPDIEVHFNPTKGLSNNRNVALELATAPFVLIADDDLNYYAEGLRAAIKAYETNPSVDVFLFRYDSPSKKIYPPVETDLHNNYRHYNPTSVEIGLRMPTSLRFNPAFGIGAPVFACGEEAMLLAEARDKGLTLRFFPIALCSHPSIPTGLVLPTPGVLMAEGAVIRRLYPLTGLPRLILKALRTPTPLIPTFRLLLKGWSTPIPPINPGKNN